jgi:uncharacterized protein DUF742
VNVAPDEPLRDEAAGRLVPPWMRTGGRTAPNHHLDLLTVVRSTRARDPREFDMDHAEVLIRCHATSLSVVELAGHMHEPPLIIKVLVSDLIDEDAVEAVAPQDYSCGLTDEQLQILLAGLEARL